MGRRSLGTFYTPQTKYSSLIPCSSLPLFFYYILLSLSPSSFNLKLLSTQKSTQLIFSPHQNICFLQSVLNSLKVTQNLVCLVRDSGDKQLWLRIAPGLLFPNLIQILLMSTYSISRPLIQIPKCAWLRYVSLPTHQFGMVMFLKMFSPCFSLNPLKTKNSSDYRCV
jgi:hypothetical protein